MSENGTVRAPFLNSEIPTLDFHTTPTFSVVLPYSIALVVLFLLAMLQAGMKLLHLTSVHIGRIPGN